MDAKSQTLERLKSPSTAVFIDSLTTIVKLKSEDLNSNVYSLGISVDAQNTYGAMIRERYRILYDLKGGDSLDIKNYVVKDFF